MIPCTALLIDSDDDSAALLMQTLASQGLFGRIERTSPGLGIPAALTSLRPDLVVFNHHFDRPDDLLSCATAKLALPDAVVVAIVAPGPPGAMVRRWAAESGHLAAVLQKPLATEDLRTTVADLLRAQQAAQALRTRSEQMATMLPQSALAALEAGEGMPREELFEAAVLFTDVRRSSDFITRSAPREFFLRLNRTLGAQAEVVRGFEGEVIKYTGDGLMAIFRGMGRAHLALRCGLALAAASGKPGEMPYGIGVAEGLVLAGLVGADGPVQRRQYDVIGATVHLAARLCGQAGAGELLTTQRALAASRLQAVPTRQLGAVEVRGFPGAIECVAFQAQAVD